MNIDINASSVSALYGGTFNPVHYGHLKSVESLIHLIKLKQIIIIPNNIPPHRDKLKISNYHRKRMIELAIAGKPLFKLDDRELNRNSVSYTYQTLREWRDECGLQQSLAFIIGQDSLLTFSNWFQYKNILDNSHLIVCRRPGFPLITRDFHTQKWLEKHITNDINDLYKLPSSKIFLAKTPLFNISSTIIRRRLQQGLSCTEMVPDRVLGYIKQKEIYKT